MKSTESPSRFLAFGLDVKFWVKSQPDVETARPARCPECDAPGCDAGRVVLHGHGQRARRVWIQDEACGEVVEQCIHLRRYVCQRCRAVLTVGPRGLLPRRHYSASMMAHALWKWAVDLRTDAAVRVELCACDECGLSRPERWTTLRRWARAARDGELWSSPVVMDPSWTLRSCAGRVVRWLRSLGDPSAVSDEAGLLSAIAHAR